VAAVPDASLLGPEVFLGIDTHELAGGGLFTSIVGMNAKLECALLEQRADMDWVDNWLTQPMHAKHVSLHVAVDTSRLGALLAPLAERAGCPAVGFGADEMASAAPALRAAMKQGQITMVQHSPALTRAVKAGRQRLMGGGPRWLWFSHAGDDLAPLVAMTLAHITASQRPFDPWVVKDYGGDVPAVHEHGGALWPTFSDLG
jgi:hypothetical protein